MFVCSVCGDLCDDCTACDGCKHHEGIACGVCCPSIKQWYYDNKEWADSIQYCLKLYIDDDGRYVRIPTLEEQRGETV